MDKAKKLRQEIFDGSPDYAQGYSDGLRQAWEERAEEEAARALQDEEAQQKTPGKDMIWLLLLCSLSAIMTVWAVASCAIRGG